MHEVRRPRRACAAKHLFVVGPADEGSFTSHLWRLSNVDHEPQDAFLGLVILLW